MWLDRVSNPGPLALESDVLPTALLGPAVNHVTTSDRVSTLMNLVTSSVSTMFTL